MTHDTPADVLMRHERYVAALAYDEAGGTFHGRVNNVTADITFSGRSVEELQSAFRRAVSAYRAACEAEGREPETPL
jgi:predicted HicB family RNase H-like nuclease